MLLLYSLSIVGCGTIYTRNDNSTREKDTQADESESTTTALWDQDVQVDKCETIFQRTDLTQHDDYSVIWENTKGQAKLEFIDEKVYLTYKSELGECTNAIFDYIQPNRIPDTEFFEEDINSDGQKELLITYLQATGTGCQLYGMCIYDLSTNNLIPLFEKDPKLYHFSDKQKQDMFDIITLWNSQNFQDKTGVIINDASHVGSEIFQPSLVKVNGKYMIQVGFLLQNENDRRIRTDFYVLLEFYEDQLKVNDLWCKL